MVVITNRRNVPDNNGNRGKDVVEFTVDEVQDIQSLPGIDEVSAGSTAFVIVTGEVYMLGSEGWRKI
jgi:hypothetical protein